MIVLCLALDGDWFNKRADVSDALVIRL